MDKTKVGLVFVIGSLVLYAGYRYYQSKQASGTADQLPAQSEMQYYSTPPTVSAQGSPGGIYVGNHQVSQTISSQNGKQIYSNGQAQTYPMV